MVRQSPGEKTAFAEMSILNGSMAPHAGKKRKLAHREDESYLGEPNMGEDTSEEASIGDELRSEANPWARRTDGVNAGAFQRTATRHGVRSSEQSTLDAALLSSGGMGRSAMLTLQINELLSEVRPNYERRLSHLEDTLRKLKQVIESLPDVAPMLAIEAEKSLSKDTGATIPFPHPRPTKDTKYTLEYRKPANINVVGSLPLKLSVKGQKAVDMAVTMPQSMFQEKDYLNHRLFHKRAYYLARIAAGIRKHAEQEFEIEYSNQDDIQYLPLIVIKPVTTLSQDPSRSNVYIRVLVAIPEATFPVEKTLPTKNCLRSTWPEGQEAILATPFYNSCIRLTASYAAYHALLHKTIVSCDSFRDVCLLGRIWLRQRGLGSAISAGGFGGFEFSIVCALLLLGGGPNGGSVLSTKYNPLQLFKAILQFLATKDLSKPLLLNAENLKMTNTESPVLYDGLRGVNVLLKMRPWSYRLIREEASLSLQAMNARNQDNFDSTFIMRSGEPLTKFDEVYCCDLSATEIPLAVDMDAGDMFTKIYNGLVQGLGNRVRLVHMRTPGMASWPIKNSSKGKASGRQRIDVGLLLQPEHANRLVDHGPSVEEQEAAKTFRDFWGEKAELRRFKDGSISESLVWSENAPVIQQIVSYILQRHFNLPPESITALVNNLDSVIAPQTPLVRPSNAFKLVNDAYQSLVTELYQLEGMPLSIRSISPADPQLRYASLHCPLVSSPIMPANVLIQFEGSARWPDSLPAIQHTKIAFLTKLADLLSASNTTVTTRVGLENTSTASSGHLNTSFLDIIYPSPSPGQGLRPISFRIRIHHERTLTLLETALSPSSKSTLPVSTRETLAAALSVHKRLNLAAPLHTTTLSNLCTRHPALSSTIRLLKKWTASHLLLSSSHIADEILELLAVHIFQHPFPFSPPATPQTAFLRILLFLSHWDWISEPLIIDLGGDSSSASSESISTAQHAEIQTRFTAWRKLDPAINNVVLFIASNLDPTGVVWTQGARPSKVVAARLTALAKASVGLVKSKGLEMGRADWESLFTTPMGDFDFVIHLRKEIVKSYRVSNSAEEKYKNLTLRDGLDVESIGFDPVGLYLDELEGAFGPNVLFFHDADGGEAIAGLWNPRALGRKTWRVRLGYSSMPVTVEEEGREGTDGQNDDDSAGEGKGVVVMNQSGILAEIAMMGEGLVDRIEVVKELAH